MILRLFCGALILEIFFHTISSVTGDTADKTLMCFHNSYSINGTGDGFFAEDDIDLNLCTHTVYWKIDLYILNYKIVKSPNFFNVENGHNKFTELKAKNPQLKVLIHLELFPRRLETIHFKLMADSNHADVLAGKIVAFLQQYNFDGIFLDFFPLKKDKLGFMNLSKTIKKAFLPHSYILSIPGSCDASIIHLGHDIPSVIRDVDFLILRKYHFRAPDEESNQVDHTTSLFREPSKTTNYKHIINNAIHPWVIKGFPPEKILLGIAFWGRTWTLLSNDSIPPADTFGFGSPGRNYTLGGSMSYSEICEAVVKKGWQVFQDSDQTMGPYAVSPDIKKQTWVGYDDPAIAVKKSEYIVSKELGGVAVMNVSMDDFENKCGGGSYPMLTAISNTLFLNTFKNITSPNITLPSNVTLADIEDLWFRQKAAFIFSLIVSSCYLLTICYMLYLLYVYRSGVIRKHDFTDLTYIVC